MSDEEKYDVNQDAETILSGRPDRRVEDIDTDSSILKTRQKYTSVVQGIYHTVDDPESQWLQVLHTTCFRDEREADLASDAINELIHFNIPVTPAVAKLVARNAVRGARGGTTGNVVEAITHVTYNTNNEQARKRFFQRGAEDTDGNGPLS